MQKLKMYILQVYLWLLADKIRLSLIVLICGYGLFVASGIEYKDLVSNKVVINNSQELAKIDKKIEKLKPKELVVKKPNEDENCKPTDEDVQKFIIDTPIVTIDKLMPKDSILIRLRDMQIGDYVVKLDSKTKCQELSVRFQLFAGNQSYYTREECIDRLDKLKFVWDEDIFNKLKPYKEKYLKVK